MNKDDNSFFIWNSFLAEDIRKVEYLQELLLQFTNSGVGFIDPDNPSPIEREILIDYFHHLYALLEYTSILSTRLQLMDDKTFVGIELAVNMVCATYGLRDDESINAFCFRMKSTVKKELTNLTGIDMDSYEGIDVEFKE